MPIRKRALSTPLSAPPSGDEDIKLSLKRTPKRTPTKATSNARQTRGSARSSAKSKKEELDAEIDDEAILKNEPITPSTPKRARKNRSSVKKEGKDTAEEEDQDPEKPKPTLSPSKSTLTKKLKQLEAYLQTPFPEHTAPTPEQCQQVQDALAKIHGLPKRPEVLIDKAGGAAGCGAVPDVLDALIRTILSQNTTSKNSTAAKNAMDAKYGRANHIGVHQATLEDLASTIACGGLANVKAKVIKEILSSVLEREILVEGKKEKSDIKQISLDYLHNMSDLDAMKELISFAGVGPKTASCVLLFCLGRNSFAVDTHVFRITKALGWTPGKANRETAFQHLDVRIPSENKYPLHSLLVRHGRSCRLCSANGNITESEVSSAECPIKAYLRSSTKSKTKKSLTKKKGSKRGEVENEDKEEGAEEEDDEEEEEELIMPGDIKDEDEEMGKPPAGAPIMKGGLAVKQEEKVAWENFGENKEGQMHGL